MRMHMDRYKEMAGKRRIGCAWTCLALLCATPAPAYAHFHLSAPQSWLDEDELGGPQKGSPCGPGDARPFLGDDVQPIPVSGELTTFHAGETITVAWEETVYHPGYFRISLARTSAADATSADFPDPALTDPVACNYDRAAVQTAPHGDVLADGLFMAEAISSSNRSLMQEVTLPDEPCERCTLQVVQVMENHGGSSCFYFHCAEIEILAADDGEAGAGGVAGADGAGASAADGGVAGGTAGMGTAAAASESGGCAVAPAGARGATSASWCLLAIPAVVRRLRRRRVDR